MPPTGLVRSIDSVNFPTSDPFEASASQRKKGSFPSPDLLALWIPVYYFKQQKHRARRDRQPSKFEQSNSQTTTATTSLTLLTSHRLGSPISFSKFKGHAHALSPTDFTGDTPGPRMGSKKRERTPTARLLLRAIARMPRHLQHRLIPPRFRGWRCQLKTPRSWSRRHSHVCPADAFFQPCSEFWRMIANLPLAATCPNTEFPRTRPTPYRQGRMPGFNAGLRQDASAVEDLPARRLKAANRPSSPSHWQLKESSADHDDGLPSSRRRSSFTMGHASHRTNRSCLGSDEILDQSGGL